MRTDQAQPSNPGTLTELCDGKKRGKTTTSLPFFAARSRPRSRVTAWLRPGAVSMTITLIRPYSGSVGSSGSSASSDSSVCARYGGLPFRGADGMPTASHALRPALTEVEGRSQKSEQLSIDGPPQQLALKCPGADRDEGARTAGHDGVGVNRDRCCCCCCGRTVGASSCRSLGCCRRAAGLRPDERRQARLATAQVWQTLRPSLDAGT